MLLRGSEHTTAAIRLGFEGAIIGDVVVHPGVEADIAELAGEGEEIDGFVVAEATAGVVVEEAETA